MLHDWHASYTTLIRAVHFQGWADELIARQKLPSVVRRLIHATVDNPRLVQLPADEGTGRSSWDGIVECDAGNAWVPSGTSVWEMGTDLRVKAKADSEYGKRTAKPDSIIPAKSTFVFVTPRKWEGKRKWQQAKRAEGIWQSVCAWDCADLEEWLERAPAVDMWLARLLRKLPSTGISDPLARWENLAAISAPPLVPAVFLAGREKAADDFRQALKGSAHEFAVSTTSAQELADFACAVLASSDEFTQDAEAARVLVVNRLWRCSSRVWSWCAATRLSSTRQVAASAPGARPPPCAWAATLPPWRKRRDRSRTKLRLTSKRRAICAWLPSPFCHAPNIFCLKSKEYAFAIHNPTTPLGLTQMGCALLSRSEQRRALQHGRHPLLLRVQHRADRHEVAGD